MLRTFAGIAACAVFVGAASFGTAGVPDLVLSTARTHDGPETPVLLNLPDGGGRAFTQAAIVGGTVDATVYLTLLDSDMAPVPFFPREDLWLEAADPGQEYSFNACAAGSIADADTDVNGQTQWANPLRAGGAAQTVTDVYVNGSPLANGSGLPLWHNSPDINADGIVNLSDVPLFAGDYFGGLDPFRSDFEYDQVVNLSDVVKLAQGLGAECP